NTCVHMCTYHCYATTPNTPFTPFLPPALNQRSKGNLFLNPSPYQKNTSGIAPKASAMNAKRLFPQPNPKLSYMLGPASGRTALSRERRTVAAARADAA
ncbi:MAG: hypothetical protein Q9197_005400, partial [Variospora fuerteventurae]